MYLRGLRDAVRGDDASAAHSFEAANDALLATHLGLQFAAASRYWLGQYRGGDPGRELIASALAYFEAEGIRRPERVIEMLTPARATCSTR